MFRILAVLLLAMISYFSLKSWLTPARPAARKPDPRPEDDARPDGFDPRASGEMVRDPVCGTYIETTTSVTAVIGGRSVHFCSLACRDRFLAEPKMN
jgi:YHS domain-containing protein